MARTQSFDRDDVVRAARTVFWNHGYESTSIPDLEAATGLSRSSIYNTFASKRGLFDAAVQNYLDEIVRPRLSLLQAEAVAPTAITSYLTGLREAFLTLGSPASENGCLLINAAGTPLATDEHVARVISDYRAELHEAILRGIRSQDPSRAAAEHDRLAEIVTSHVVAAFALARVDAAQAARGLDAALALLTR